MIKNQISKEANVFNYALKIFLCIYDLSNSSKKYRSLRKTIAKYQEKNEAVECAIK